VRARARARARACLHEKESWRAQERERASVKVRKRWRMCVFKRVEEKVGVFVGKIETVCVK